MSFHGDLPRLFQSGVAVHFRSVPSIASICSSFRPLMTVRCIYCKCTYTYNYGKTSKYIQLWQVCLSLDGRYESVTVSQLLGTVNPKATIYRRLLIGSVKLLKYTPVFDSPSFFHVLNEPCWWNASPVISVYL